MTSSMSFSNSKSHSSEIVLYFDPECIHSKRVVTALREKRIRVFSKPGYSSRYGRRQHVEDFMALNRHIPRMNKKQLATLTSYVLEILDNSESVMVFKMLCSLCVSCFKSNNEANMSDFRDFIDIVLGWMISDFDEPFQSVPSFCASILQDLSNYFKDDLDFTSSLITQLFEDFQEAVDKLKSDKQPYLHSLKTLRLVTTAVTLLSLGCSLDKEHLLSLFEQFTQLVSSITECPTLKKKFKFELITVSNECLACEGVDGPHIRSYIRDQLKFVNETKDWTRLPKAYILSFLSCLSSWVEAASSQAQLNTEIENIFEETTKYLDAVSTKLSAEDQAYILKVVHSLLRTRNAACLQKSYSWCLAKLTTSSNNSRLDIENNLFVIAGVTDIAGIKTGSILSQWALDPTIFDLLVSIIYAAKKQGLERPDCIAALCLMRVHCEAHSHFISSIASSKSYMSESIGTRSARFLPTLMKLWLNLLTEAKHLHRKRWLVEWILGFVKSSAPFISLLLVTEQEFYTSFVHILIRNVDLHSNLLEFLSFVQEDQYYRDEESMIDILREAASTLLLLPNLDAKVKEETSNLVKNLPAKISIFTPSNHDEIAFANSSRSRSDVGQPKFFEVTANEFNAFLYNLLSFEKPESSQTNGYGLKEIEAMVEFLMQSKLKTTVAKPVEFFAHLKNLLKKHRKTKLQIPSWKLDFLYILEKQIVNAIYGSAFIRCNLSPMIRNFYQTNKSSCIEWLKRFRSDLAELSLLVENYSNAFLNSTLAGEDLVAKFALLELSDSAGLKGLNELCGYYYLRNEVENAIKVVKTMDPENTNSFQNLILKRSESIMNTASSSLEHWQNNASSQGATNSVIFKLKQPTSLLTLQLDAFRSKNNVSDVKLVEDIDAYRQLSLIEMIQISEIVKRVPSVSPECKQATESIKVEAMMDHENFNYARTALAAFELIAGKPDFEYSLTWNHVSNYKNLADLNFQDGNMNRSAKMYVNLMDLIDNDSINKLDLKFKVKFYLSFASKLQTSKDFFNEALLNSTFLNSIQDNNSILQSIYETATLVSQLDGDAWLEYGNFAFAAGNSSESNSIEIASAMKTIAQQCYSTYFVLNTKHQPKKESNWKAMQLRTRLLRLYESGYKFNPEHVLIQEDWLPLLPSLTRISDLRPHLILRFPEEASFLVAVYSRGRKFKRIKGRRGIFDYLAYSLTELNEESYNASCHDECTSVKNKYANFCCDDQDESLLSEKRLLEKINPTVLLIMEELERIGCLREELWSWSIDKVIPDATRRLSALRKDMARSADLLKLKAYVFPLLSYLKELWNFTKQTDTQAETAFLNKYGSRIESFLQKLEAVQSSEDFNNVIDDILAFRCIFDTSLVAKLDLENISPKLFNLNYISNTATVSIPGFPSSVYLSRTHCSVACFNSKAKPKRLSFIGSNGNIYNYLVKGNENLFLDAGVMQLLRIVQDIVGLPTHSYSVTPFGEKGGLIQFVENAPAVYEIYKRHLQRINCTEKPLYMFYRVLNDMGYTDRSNFEALKSVFTELVNVTDSEVISRELFLCSNDCSSWYKSIRNFTCDSALSSAIGYLVGIGDRHLDNILVNPKTGNLIHVDYSLVFERGSTLPVPEIVPFRLTRNFSSPLQYPGNLGPYRVYMEEFIDIFKKREDTFLYGVEEISIATQLEDSFVVNPEIILTSELHSAVTLLRIRSKNLLNNQQSLMKELVEIIDRNKNLSNFSWQARTDSINDKLKKKLFRWRRLLANLDPLIQFIARYAHVDESLENFQQIVTQNWLPNIIHFWCHSLINELMQQTNLFADNLHLAEATLQSLLFHLPSPENMDCNLSMLTLKEKSLDGRKVEAKLDNTKNKLLSFESNTVEKLVSRATNEDNLCKMFEGWTPWF